MKQVNSTKDLILGLIIVPVVASLAYIVSFQIGQYLGFDKSPLSPVIIAIFLGLFLSNVVKLSYQSDQVIKFYLTYVLKIGIILLGIRISFTEILTYGKLVLPLVIIVIIAVLILAKLVGKLLKLTHNMTILVAVGTAICGITAIVATAPIINAKKEETSYAVAVIAIFGSISMLTYPYLSYILFDGDMLKAALFLGSAIHDTAQVAGSALIYAQQFNSLETLDIATITKLIRNSLMIVVIPLLVIIYAQKNSKIEEFNYKKVLPLFILGFLLMALLRSIGDLTLEQGGKAFALLTLADYNQLIKTLQSLALICFVLAMTALGFSINIKDLINISFKPVIFGFMLASFAGVVSFGILTLF